MGIPSILFIHQNISKFIIILKMAKLLFSGHETFQCKSLWLKKSYDFLHDGNTFSQSDAVVKLGVGKNMVSSIRYWTNAFGFLSEKDELAKFLFGSRGKDPFLENIGSLWILHHRLISQGVASIFSLVFNGLRKERIEFTKNQMINFLKRKCQEHNEAFKVNIVERDIGVFLKSYLQPRGKVQNIEDEFSGIFLELGIIEEIEGAEDDLGKRYRIAGCERPEIPIEVILFCILSNAKYGLSISFYELLSGYDSIGTIFALNSEGLRLKIQELTTRYKDITYKEDAGIRELQFKTKPDRWDVMKSYYAK